MPSDATPDPTTGASSDEVSQQARVRQFSSRVTWALIVLCNGVLVVGVWMSGVNLDDLVKTPDTFDPASDICLRLTWEHLSGASDPIRVCSEWINLSDPAGQPHRLDKHMKLKREADGRYYVDREIAADYRLIAFVGFVVVVVISGLLIRRHLVDRYRLRVGLAATQNSTGIH